jgi:hypothetical protein
MGRFAGRGVVALDPKVEGEASPWILFASSARTASTQAGSGAAERVARLAFRELLAAIADFLRDGVGTKAGSWSSCEEVDESESTGEGSELELEEIQEGAMPMLMFGIVGIWRPGRVGELLAESGVSLFELVSVLEDELARSSESSRDAGEIGVIGIRANKSSGAMQVGACCC